MRSPVTGTATTYLSQSRSGRPSVDSSKMVRVCVLGAGPSGMAVLYHIKRLNREKPDADMQVVCFERQSTWGGLWNYTWRTGLDEHGENVHGSMYRGLFSNGPKEASLEFPDYTFQEHFGKPIGSFPPREVIYDYITARWERNDLKGAIRFNYLVRHVEFDPVRDKFRVVVKDLNANVVLPEQEFDFVVNCTGHFSVPNVPDFPGIDRFPGRVIHSHDFRNAEEFKGLRVLSVGASYSSEDMALQNLKFGAKSVICSYRSKAMGFAGWPEGAEERPLLLRLDGKTAHFKDGSSAEVDAIILCTGYQHHYPYLDERLRLKGPNELYNPNLYKGTVWMLGGKDRFLYVGVQDQYYTFTMFDAQARWAVKYMAGDVRMPSDRDEAVRDMAKWRDRSLNLKDCHEDIDFQTDFTVDLATSSDYGHNLDIGVLFHKWEKHKYANISTYRDHAHYSVFTGVPTPAHPVSFMKALDDSKEAFLKQYGL